MNNYIQRSKQLISVARGDAPADLLLTNALVVNTFTAEVLEGNVAIVGHKIAGVGDYHDAHRLVDVSGQYLVPGLIDGHCHPESTHLSIQQYARAVVPRGTLAIVTDLHEIANVCGVQGIADVLRQSRGLPFDLFVTAPSCVPATSLETSGAHLGPTKISKLMRLKGVIGLGEYMDFPSLIRGERSSLEVLQTAGKRPKEGHAPGLVGKPLQAYMAPLIGSDHETVEYQEGLEKLRAGMHLMIREGSSEKNLEALLPLVTDTTYPRCMLVVDDRDARDIMTEGDMDAVVRKAIALGLDPIRALQLATINPATYFGLRGLGAIAPGYQANFLVVEDVHRLTINDVYYHGHLVGHRRRPTFSVQQAAHPSTSNIFHIRPFTGDSLALEADGVPNGTVSYPVIEVVPGQIITRWRWEQLNVNDGRVIADIEDDLLKLVVVERHHATGNIGKGLVKGFGLKHGALATSVAHDSHNVVAVGTADSDIFRAIKEVEALQGGLVVVNQGMVLASLALPLAGLLSPEPLEVVVQSIEDLEAASLALGCTLPAPFSVLSFLALPVIPELRLSDRGLVDPLTATLLTQPIKDPVTHHGAARTHGPA